MVNPVTSYGKSGLHDWLMQRFTAIILVCFFIYLFNIIFTVEDFSYAHWRHTFDQLEVKIFTLLSVVSLLVHSWIGIWTVLTDYVKITFLRTIFQLLIISLYFAYLIWAINILWD